MSIYHNLEDIKLVAISYAQDHGVNYNIILMNPDAEGNFTKGSTYEFVTDSYFEKDRPNVKLICKTDSLIEGNGVNFHGEEIEPSPIILRQPQFKIGQHGKSKYHR